MTVDTYSTIRYRSVAEEFLNHYEPYGDTDMNDPDMIISRTHRAVALLAMAGAIIFFAARYF